MIRGLRPIQTALALALCAVGAVAGGAERPAPEDSAPVLDTLLGKLYSLPEIDPSELSCLVEETGGVRFRTPVPIDYLSTAELKAYLREVLDDEYPPDKANADARTLAAFGLLEPGTDLRSLRRRLLEQNIAGFYDERPSRRRLYAVSEDRRLTPMNQMILSHELRHAMQDQYADVYDLLAPEIGDYDDRRLALVSVLEGDATFVMAQFLGRRLESIDVHGDWSALSMPSAALPGAPDVVRDQMQLPYSIGLNFVRELWRRGGWESVRKAWSHPPQSTDEVLHPEKYAAGEPVPVVALEYRPAKSRPLSAGVLGEIFAHTLLGDDAEPAAALGWAGDRFVSWDLDGRTLLVWRSRWSDEPHAKAIRAGLVSRYARSHGQARNDGGWALFRKAKWTVACRRQGSEVWLVASDDRAASARARRSLLPRLR